MSSIRPKEPEDRRITLNMRQMRVLFYSSVIFLPLIVVAAGLGVSIISASFARDQVLAGRVKLIPIKGEELWRELGVAYRRDRTLTRATTTFISTVRQLAAVSK